jgi:hypothetical protein
MILEPDFLQLVIAGGNVTAHGRVRHIAGPAFHSIVHAQLAYRTQRLIVKRWHAQSRPQLFVELP